MKAILYTPGQLDIKLVPGERFINGGWYQGHQYYFGTLSAKGEIHLFRFRESSETLAEDVFRWIMEKLYE